MPRRHMFLQVVALALVATRLVPPTPLVSRKGNKSLDSPTLLEYIWLVENSPMSEPKSLQQAILYFSKPENCTQYLAARRWPDGVICPGCGSDKVSYNPERRTWKCSSHHPRREFSVKVGTIFED